MKNKKPTEAINFLFFYPVFEMLLDRDLKIQKEINLYSKAIRKCTYTSSYYNNLRRHKKSLLKKINYIPSIKSLLKTK